MKCKMVILAVAVLLLSAPPLLAQEETVNLEGFDAGAIISQVFGSGGSGPILVNGSRPGRVENFAVIYDSSCGPSGTSADCTGMDQDLGTPNETFGGPGIGSGGEVGRPFENDTALGNLLIIQQRLRDENNDGLVDDPNDADEEGAILSFDFSLLSNGVATVVALHIIDVEAGEPAAEVQFFDPDGLLIGIFSLPQTGNNGVAQVFFGPVSGVATMEVHLNGSGAIDNLIFSSEDGDGEGGCTPGFWKVPPHLNAWVPTGYSPGQTVQSVFAAASAFPSLGSSTLLQALSFGGGPGPTGGAMILLRAAVAALLNSSHPDVAGGYPLTEMEVIDQVNAALASGNRATMLALATDLDDANNLGCPIDDDD